MKISKKIHDRITSQIKKYQSILEAAKARDISESDTVVIIADMLSDIFGYKKYEEITTEFAIRNTFVDLAIKVGNDVRFLIEAKAINVDLKDTHVKQAIDYGANQGIEWVILTNGQTWQVYKIEFKQPIDKTLVFEVNLLNISNKDSNLVNCFGNLSKECYATSSMNEFFAQKVAISRYSLAAIILDERVLSTIRKEVRELVPKLKIDENDIRQLVQNEVIKRDLLEGDEAKSAMAELKKLQRAANRKANKKTSSKTSESNDNPSFKAKIA